MSRVTVTELRAYLSSPVKAAGGDGGLVSDAGAVSTDARFTEAEIQDALDAADDIIDGAFYGLITIPAASNYARRMARHFAAAELLGADSVEISVTGEQSRASWHRQQFDTLLEYANRYPRVFGATVSDVYTAGASD